MICGSHLARSVCIIGLVAIATSALAQAWDAPLPPPRPSGLGTAPSQSRPAPATKTAPTVDQLPPLDPDHPPVLPPASRVRMRECGKEWEAMKMAGKDEIGWRAFATACLTR